MGRIKHCFGEDGGLFEIAMRSSKQYTAMKNYFVLFSRAQVHFRGPAPHHPSPSSPWLPSLGFRLFMSAAFPLTKAIETLFWSCQIYCSVPSMMTTKELIEISPGAGKIRENLIWTVIPTVKMAQMVSAGETTLYFQKENFPQLSAGLSVNCDIVAPIMIVPPSNMQSSYFLIEKLCAWVCLEGCLGIELCLGVCRRGFLNTNRANRPSCHWAGDVYFWKFLEAV